MVGRCLDIEGSGCIEFEEVLLRLKLIILTNILLISTSFMKDGYFQVSIHQ